MASQLSTKKRLLTTAVNKLENVVSKLQAEKLEELPIDPQALIEAVKENVSRLEEGIFAINFASSRAEKELADYGALLDSLTEKEEKEVQDYQTYSIKAESALSKAFDLGLLIQARRQALVACASATNTATVSNNHLTQIRTPQPKPLELPPLPIPTFGGNLWEWDNFWEIFNSNIHSQDIPEMVKYNYLINALKGEARECIRKFQVTKGNYSKAIAFLLRKYDNREVLVNQLVEKLDHCSLRSPAVKDQRTLLEQVQVLIAQLKEKGEETNSSWLVKKVLSKFPNSIKRKVINKRQGLPPDVPFTMDILIQYLEEVLSTEEMFLLMSDTTSTTRRPYNSLAKSPPKGATTKTCMYCQGYHSPNHCVKYATPQERARYLRNNQLCMICASSEHGTTACKGKFCFKCNGPHHTSCCFRQFSSNKTPHLGNNSGIKRPSVPPSSKFSEKTNERGGKNSRTIHTKTRTNLVTVSESTPPSNTSSDNNPGNNLQEDALHPQSVLSAHASKRPYLPTGELTFFNPETESLSKTHVLLDTGSEMSFIDQSLADRLKLPVLQERELLLRTFGSNTPQPKRCKVVSMKVWDKEGTLHSLELLTHDVLIMSYKAPKVSQEDFEFITSLQLRLHLAKDTKLVTPSILLGCDQLWPFMRHDAPPIPLPSGLYILPTKLGYLISGKPKAEESQILHVTQPTHNNLEHWEKYWAMEAVQAYTITTEDSEITEEEKDQWEKFWTMDAAGTEEFTGPEKEARAAQDQRVWQKFNETIQKRDDGYYVRLPWKEQYPKLPDNRALAYKRLVNVWASISKDKDLLEQYNNIFQEQLRQGIIEPVNEYEPIQGAQLHYIPHQPVITPQKSTTKLRIVFDASAHYRGCPSLNDVLYRGPVILPSLYGLFLRFRIGKIAITSDVEKAFLQIHLQEQDRDSTRCFWLYDHTSAPGIDNTRTFRFTRVTFGLKSSPFLLAGTTHYHLNNYVEDSPLVQEIKRNLYVDNLILTSDSYEGAQRIYKETKQIFQNLKMNLREFTSNNNMLVNYIEGVDRSPQVAPKVLGLTWNILNDTVQMRCVFPDIPVLTKRSVTSAIASIYDPMGWLVPLLHKSKVFLQDLWKEQYDWDTELSMEKREEWNCLAAEVHGFEGTVPRYLAPKGADAVLVTFADASSSAIAVCTYLCYDGKAHLLMAKSKLPTLHVQYTIPKLELNAITLAMRLTHSVLSQLQSCLNIGEVYLFSDSEIVISWLKLRPEREVGQFVNNRLVEILNISNSIQENKCIVKIGYIPSENNPADCGTRGLTREEIGSHFWWSGPSFLHTRPIKWPLTCRIFEYPLDHNSRDSNANNNDTDIGKDGNGTHLSNNNAIINEEGKNDLLTPRQVLTFTKAKRIMAYKYIMSM